jgi:hypothetical protein
LKAARALSTSESTYQRWRRGEATLTEDRVLALHSATDAPAWLSPIRIDERTDGRVDLARRYRELRQAVETLSQQFAEIRDAPRLVTPSRAGHAVSDLLVRLPDGTVAAIVEFKAPPDATKRAEAREAFEQGLQAAAEQAHTPDGDSAEVKQSLVAEGPEP